MSDAASSVLERARAWLADDPSVEDRAELSALIDAKDIAELTTRFEGPLQFGTAGLRGLIGAGESRMNRKVVMRATWGLAQYLLRTVPDAATRGIVIGRDGRFRSEEFQQAAAEVAAAAGLQVWWLPATSPTPLIAYAVSKVNAAGGIAVTASHNPPEYNGYKVYFDNGAQIIPPHDSGIASCIADAPPANQIATRAGPFSTIEGIEDAYVEAIAGLRTLDVDTSAVTIAYTAMHGVGEPLLRRGLAAAGFTNVVSVPEQAEPDGAFPTVKFPNPEEPGALDLVTARAVEAGADIILANDPDADRLAASVRDADGRYIALTGNEIGVLMGHHLLTRQEGGPERLVVSTVVSSTQLAKIAKALGVQYRETLTGFKWIANVAMDELAANGAKFVFGFEEAIGYSADTIVRDKDGISAAIVFAEIAAQCKASGKTVLDRLQAIRDEFGNFTTRQHSVTLPGSEGADRIRGIMSGLRDAPPQTLGGLMVESTWDLKARTLRMRDGSVTPMEALPPTNALILALENGGRAAVRPSGTEPKIKLYLEVVEAPAAAAGRLDALVADFKRLVGLA